ncbi:hypothetical protein [Photobacterium sp. R1]
MYNEKQFEEWTNQDCYNAMQDFVNFYMNGDKKEFWNNLLLDYKLQGKFPPGKGFLRDLDEAIQESRSPEMPKRLQLYERICAYCI